MTIWDWAIALVKAGRGDESLKIPMCDKPLGHFGVHARTTKDGYFDMWWGEATHVDKKEIACPE